MSVDCMDFLSSAESLVAKEFPSEIDLRAAGSRAYYGLYHKARSVIENKGLAIIRVEKAGSHEGLIATVRSVKAPSAGSLADAIKAIKRFRHNCDYELKEQIKPKYTAMKIAEVKRLMDRLDRF